MYTAAPTTTHGLSLPSELLIGEASGPDLMIFLLAHRAFRREFGRLAVAAAEAPTTGPRAAEVKAAIEAQIATMTRSLHNHHHGEDERIWPLLRERDPAGAVVLDALEAEHAEIDPLIKVVEDTSKSLSVRAVALEQLSVLINRHLDHEEESALPLIRRHYSADEWEADGKHHMKETRADLPTFACIMFDHMTEQEIAEVIGAAPKLLGWLYKLSWRSKYAKRRELVYGY
jgi:iron-sulfur cluster repair protein YtfE (RIC family)